MNNSDLITEFLDKNVIDSLSTLLASSDSAKINECAKIVASQFGDGFDTSTEENVNRLIISFRKNLTLLIEKTWVEKSDIMLKEEVLIKLDKYCTSIESGKWTESFSGFSQMLSDVIYLMFGQMARSPDFEEYSLRIDPEFGIFCWYIQNLPESNDWSDEKSKAVLLIAMFFLANY
jgi:hypothetical protein